MSEQDGSDRRSVCLSGGAQGADLRFGELATASGHRVIHYGFEGMRSNVQLQILSAEQLKETVGPLKEAAAFLQRGPPRKPYVQKLIQRNYFQVNTAHRIYAITRWNLVDKRSKETMEGKLGGGTGWAVAMGIALQVPEIYLFAMEKALWYRYSYAENRWERIDGETVPTPEGRYAGIGSRDISEEGEQALRDLYGAVNQKNQPSLAKPGQRVIPGMAAQADKGKSKSALKREKRKAAQQRKEEEEAKRKEMEAAAAAAAQPAVDPEKSARKLKKTLKQIDDLKTKDASTLNDDQKAKLASEEALRTELASLGI